MEDLEQKIDNLLNSPDGMAKIQSAMAVLSGGAEEPVPSLPAEPTLPDLSALTGLLPLLGNLNSEDNNTALLRALRPHLHGEREHRVEEAIQMMKMMKLLPLLSGLGRG